jgi:hypothetical protein
MFRNHCYYCCNFKQALNARCHLENIYLTASISACGSSYFTSFLHIEAHISNLHMEY